MKMKNNKYVQWTLLSALMIWGMFSFMILAGDEKTNEPLTLLNFFLIKFGAFASLALCCLVGRLLYKARLLPEIDVEE